MAKARYLFQNQAANVAIGSSGRESVDSGRFMLKVWSPTADWDGGTVKLYIMAAGDFPLLVETFTEDTVYFGRCGESGEIEVFGCDLTGTAGDSADICVTISG